jgi:hypothetical protein
MLAAQAQQREEGGGDEAASGAGVDLNADLDSMPDCRLKY